MYMRNRTVKKCYHYMPHPMGYTKKRTTNTVVVPRYFFVSVIVFSGTCSMVILWFLDVYNRHFGVFSKYELFVFRHLSW